MMAQLFPAPTTTYNSNTLNGVTSTWTNLDLSNKPNFTITTPTGADFQFTESYSRLPFKSHNNTENNNYPKRHKHNKHLLKLISICLLGTASPTFASDIGGVSATANPVANLHLSDQSSNTSFTRSYILQTLMVMGYQCQGSYHERYSIPHRKYCHKSVFMRIIGWIQCTTM